jgi:hypothetical protein
MGGDVLHDHALALAHRHAARRARIVDLSEELEELGTEPPVGDDLQRLRPRVQQLDVSAVRRGERHDRLEEMFEETAAVVTAHGPLAYRAKPVESGHLEGHRGHQGSAPCDASPGVIQERRRLGQKARRRAADLGSALSLEHRRLQRAARGARTDDTP